MSSAEIHPLSRSRGFTLLEMMIAVFIASITIAFTLLAIQLARHTNRMVGTQLVAENICVAIMESVKRSGYNEIVYSGALPDVLEIQAGTSALLDFPRRPAGGETLASTLPAGAAGSAHSTSEYAPGSSTLASDTNFYYLSNDQIRALNGYHAGDSVPEGTSLYNPDIAWGLFIEEDTALTEPIKKITIVVKYRDIRKNEWKVTSLNTIVSSVTPRI